MYIPDEAQPALDDLSRWLRESLDRSYCRIAVVDDRSERLSVAAAAGAPRTGGFDWAPHSMDGMTLDELPEACRGREPIVLDATALRATGSRFLPVDPERPDPLHELVIAPIVIGDRLVGLIDLGECRNRSNGRARSAGIERRRALPAGVTDRAGSAVDLLRWAARLTARLLMSERKGQLLEHLEAKLQRFQPEPSTLWRETAHVGAELLSAAVGAVYVRHPNTDDLVLQARHGGRALTRLLPPSCKRGEGLIGMVDPDHRAWRRWPDAGAAVTPFTGDTLRSAIAIAIRGAGVEAVLLVADDTSRGFTDLEVDILERFTWHAGHAYHRAHLSSDNRQLAHFKILRQIDEFAQQAEDLSRVLHTVLTGITAGYGLRFNRAALFRFDERARQLVGTLAVGNVTWEDASLDWQRDLQSGPQDFAQYLDAVRLAPMPPTALHKRVTQLVLPLDGDGDALREALESPKLLLFDADFGRLPSALRKLLDPDRQTEILLVPVMAAAPLGLIVVDNRFTKERIGPDVVESLVTFSSAAAIAIESFAARHDDKPVEATVHALTSQIAADDEPAVMARIVDEAARLCAASFAVFWPYHQDARRFDPPVSVNLSPRSQREIAEREPRTTGTARRILDERYCAIEDVRSDEALDVGVRELLLRIGVGSFQGIALRVGTESLGVLYVDHDRPRQFGDVDRRRLARFALHAALALKAARVLRRVDAAHRRVEALADLGSSADLGPLTDLERTFADVVTHARDVLECDVVTLHVYNASTNTFERPQHHAGDLVDTRATNLDPERDPQVARWVMRQPGAVAVDDLERHPVFGPTRFAHVESIRSCLALPLQGGSGDPVGALIANFHDRRCFTGEQLRRGTRCAEHVALAIENALRLRQNQLLASVTSELLGTATLAETLNCVVNQAATLLGGKRAGPLVSQVLLQEGAELVVRAIHGGDAGAVIGTSCAHGKGSHAGYAAEQREPIVVASYETEKRFNPADELERGFRSGVSVAMIDGGDLIGVLEVRSRNSHQFGSSPLHLLSTLAVQAAMAIKSDLRSVRARRGEGHLQALRKAEECAERVRRGVMSREAVLRELLRITVECFSLHSLGPTANTFGTLFLIKRGAVRAADMLVLETVYPPELEPRFVTKFGRERGLHERPCGITGRTVTTKAAQLVLDLHNDPDYFEVIGDSRSELAAPIMSCGNVVGVLDVESDSPRVFDGRDLETVVTLAGFVATALANHGIEHILRAAHDLGISTSVSHDTGHNLLTGIDQLDPYVLRGRLKDQVADLGFHGRLAQDIMAAAKVLNQEPLQLAATSLADVIHGVADRLVEAAASKHVVLDRTILEAGDIMMELDTDRMRQVLTNLVANAIKYTHTGGRVEIRVARHATTGRIVVSVIDTGPNPPPADELHRLFEPYYRAAPRQTSRDDVGQGLGLSIARTLVELHGGRIWAALNDRGGLTVAFDLDDRRALDGAHEGVSS